MAKADTGCTPGGGKDSMSVFYDAGLLFQSNLIGTADRHGTQTLSPIIGFFLWLFGNLKVATVGTTAASQQEFPWFQLQDGGGLYVLPIFTLVSSRCCGFLRQKKTSVLGYTARKRNPQQLRLKGTGIQNIATCWINWLKAMIV